MNTLSVRTLVIAATLAAGCAQAAQADTSAQMLERADALARQGNAAAALESLQTLVAAPDAPVRARALQVYLLTDTQQFDRARAEAERATAQHPKEASLWLARGYALRRAGQPGLAVLSYREVLKLEPTNRDAQIGLVHALKDMGSTAAAWDAAQKTPNLFDAAFLDELRHRKAIELYKLARAGAESEGERLALLDESVQLLSGRVVMTQREKSDLVIVLAERGQPADHERVIKTYEYAQRGQGLADWALVSVAASYSALGQTTRASEVLEQALQARPQDLEVRYALVYAYCDLQHFSQAGALIDKVVAELPTTSAELAFARQLQAQVALWSGDLGHAGKLLRTALASHPDHAGLRKVQTSWLQAQGRGKEARQRLAALLTAEPDDIEAQALYAQARVESLPGQTRQDLEALAKKFPDDRRVARAVAQAQRATRGDVYASTGTGGDRDSTDRTLAFSVTSPTLTGSGTRLTAEHTQVASELKNGTVHQRQDAAGVVQPLGPDWTAQALVVRNGSNHGGLRLKLVGEAFDGLGVTVRATTLDAEVPARAVAQGLTARSSALELRPRIDADVATALSLSRQALSDGNVRLGLGLTVTGRLPTLADFAPDWAVRLGADRASRTDVSYFSPARDAWGELELGLRLPSWTVADGQTLSVRPYASLGGFNQPGYGTLRTTGLGLSMNWQVSRDLSLGVAAHSVHRPYDGVYTTLSGAQVSLQSRLPW